MSTITKNVGVKYNLASLKVNIVDTAHLSNYFIISEFPDVLTAGKNLFAINGSTLLQKNSPIYLEVLDAGGNALYYELAQSGYYNYTNVTDLAISVLVDQTTVPGMGQIYLVGTTTSGQTVRWSTNIKIDPSQENHSKVIFYNSPTVLTEPSIVYILNQSISSTSMFSSTITGSVTGTSLTPKLYTDINTIDPKVTQTTYTLTTTTPGITFSDNNINTNINLYVDSITYLNNNNIITQSVNITQSYLITDVLNSKTIVISAPFTYKFNTVNQIVPINNAKFSNQFVSIGYINYSEAEDDSLSNKELVFQNQVSGSINIFLKTGYLDVIYENINTFTGNVYRHKVYRKSLNRAAEFECIADEPLVSKNILVDDITVNRMYNNLGRYYNQSHINRYYYSSSANIVLTQNSANVLDSMIINCSSPNQQFNLSQYIIVKNNSSTGSYTSGAKYIPFTSSQYMSGSGFSYDTNFIDIYPNVEYSIGANLALTSSNANSDSRLSFYLTGSYNIDNLKQDTSYVKGVGLKLAEYVIPQGQKYATFDSIADEVLFSFVNNYIGTLVIIPTNITKATISNLNISTYSEPGISPGVFTARIPFDVTIKNEQYQLKFELFDINSNSVYSQLATIINFDPNGDTLVKNISNFTPIGTPSVSASYASTSSYLNIGIYNITSSWANNVVSASYAKSSSYSLSSSNVISSSYSISGAYSLSSSNTLNSITSSYSKSSSYSLISNNSISSSHSLNSDNSTTSSYVNTASYSLSSSHSLISDNSTTSSYSLTSSYAPNYLPLTGGTVNGDVIINGTASVLVLYSVSETSSIDIVTGSTIFGQDLDSTHQFTGSIYITSSEFRWNGYNVISDNVTSSMSVATASYALNAGNTLTTGSDYPITASWSDSSSYSISSSYSLTSSYSVSSSNTISSSYSLTSSYANHLSGSPVPVSNGVYTVGLGVLSNGTITVINGIITSIVEAS